MYQRLSESKIKREIPKFIFLPIYWESYLRKHVEASEKDFLVRSIAILIAFHRKVFAFKRKVFQKKKGCEIQQSFSNSQVIYIQSLKKIRSLIELFVI